MERDPFDPFVLLDPRHKRTFDSRLYNRKEGDNDRIFSNATHARMTLLTGNISLLRDSIVNNATLMELAAKFNEWDIKFYNEALRIFNRTYSAYEAVKNKDM